MNIVIITLTTSNFDFMAVGRDEFEARAQMRAGLAEHARQTGANLPFLLAMLHEDANVLEVSVPDRFRDGSRI